jgi:uncharacterized protein
MSEPKAESGKLCPVCNKPVAEAYRPFCSKHCADVDLGRWFGGFYAVPATEEDGEDEQDGKDSDKNL